MIRRTTISTPSRRHVSTSVDVNLHHTVDGRVERRQRRSALRSHLQKLDAAHQRSEQQSKCQISQLKSELRARDREIYELQNATIIVDTERVNDLEHQVDELQARLREAETRRERRGSMSSSRRTSFVDWTLAARDPFEERSTTHMDLDMEYDAGDEDVFGDVTVAQLECGTPSRARMSFPTPPATSPVTPSLGPSRLTKEFPPTPTTASTGVQAMLPDLEKQSELESLQREMRKLTATLDNYKGVMERLERRLPEAEESLDASVEDAVEMHVDNILRTLSDRTAALTTLNTSITALGFRGDDSSDMLTSLAAAFRNARLELEYLTPGEITLPLTAHGAEVLDLLLERLRELAKKVKEGDDAIDEYHDIELNLRQQLDARVSAMDDLRADLTSAQKQLSEKAGVAQDLQVGNDRLKGAVEGYVRDIKELEQLVEKMESEMKDKDVSAADLEAQLAVATRHISDLKDELEVAQASRKKQLAAVNRRSGDALALRDARVTELREEIDRVNAALREAHETIRRLRVSSNGLDEENKGLREVVESMKVELQRVMKMSEGLLNDEPAESGKMFSAKPRRSGKKRRYDSGLCLLDEDEIEAEAD